MGLDIKTAPAGEGSTWEGRGDPKWGWGIGWWWWGWGEARGGFWQRGSRGQAWEGPECLLSYRDYSCQSSGFLRPGARAGGCRNKTAMAVGLGDPIGVHGFPRSDAAWEEGLGPLSGWCTCQSTQSALPVCSCICVCMHVCVRACMCVCVCVHT